MINYYKKSEKASKEYIEIEELKRDIMKASYKKMMFFHHSEQNVCYKKY